MHRTPIKERAMASNPKLFTITQWLLRAAIAVCVFGAGILVCVLGVVAVMGFGIWAPKEVPAMMEGVPREHVMLIVALAMLTGIVLLGLCILIFRAIDQIVASAMSGDPFVLENADRLQRIGWLLVGIYGAQFCMGVVLGVMVPPQLKDNLKFDGFDFSPLGILAVLLVFVLAQIFRHGAEMRSELEGTV
jgi:hypothetical protein